LKPILNSDPIVALLCCYLSFLLYCNLLAVVLSLYHSVYRHIPLHSYMLLPSFSFCFGIQTIQFIYSERVFFLTLYPVMWADCTGIILKGKMNLITKFAQFFFPCMLHVCFYVLNVTAKQAPWCLYGSGA
jgi:hypothetical protein